MTRVHECSTVTVDPAAVEIIGPELTERYPDEIPPRDPISFEYEVVNRTGSERTENVTARVGSASNQLSVDVPPNDTVEMVHTVDATDLSPGTYATEIESTTLPVVYDTGDIQLAELRDETPDVTCEVDKHEMDEDGVLNVDFAVSNPYEQELQFDLETYANGQRVDRFRATADPNGERTGTLAVRFDDPGDYDIEMSVVAGRLI